MVKQHKINGKQSDVWGMIDEIEEKYSDLIDHLESERPGQAGRPQAMRVTGMSIREISRIQAKRRGKK